MHPPTKALHIAQSFFTREYSLSLSRNIPRLVQKSEGSLLCPQEPTNGHISEQHKHSLCSDASRRYVGIPE